MRLINGIENVYANSVVGNVRRAQEDSYGVELTTVNGDLFVVCDGMGGHVGGKMASTIAVNSIVEFIKKDKYPDPLFALNAALQFANMQILGYAEEHPELKGMGTTACVLLLQESNAYIAHVGDSRIYLYLRDKHQLHRITKDHSYVQTLVDAGQITDDEAENHPNKNRITKALGIKKDLTPTIPTNSIQVKNRDVFVICSDGLSGMVKDKEILRILDKDTELQHRGDELIESALLNGGVDNITVELIEISGSACQISTFQSFYMVQLDNIYPKPASGKSRWSNKLLMLTVLSVVLAFVGMLIGYFIHINSIDARINDLKDEIIDKEQALHTDSLEIAKTKEKIGNRSSTISDTTALRPLSKILNEQQKLQKRHEAELDSLRVQIEKYNAKSDKWKIFKKDGK